MSRGRDVVSYCVQGVRSSIPSRQMSASAVLQRWSRFMLSYREEFQPIDSPLNGEDLRVQELVTDGGQHTEIQKGLWGGIDTVIDRRGLVKRS